MVFLVFVCSKGLPRRVFVSRPRHRHAPLLLRLRGQLPVDVASLSHFRRLDGCHSRTRHLPLDTTSRRRWRQLPQWRRLLLWFRRRRWWGWYIWLVLLLGRKRSEVRAARRGNDPRNARGGWSCMKENDEAETSLALKKSFGGLRVIKVDGILSSSPSSFAFLGL